MNDDVRPEGISIPVYTDPHATMEQFDQLRRKVNATRTIRFRPGPAGAASKAVFLYRRVTFHVRCRYFRDAEYILARPPTGSRASDLHHRLIDVHHLPGL